MTPDKGWNPSAVGNEVFGGLGGRPLRVSSNPLLPEIAPRVDSCQFETPPPRTGYRSRNCGRATPPKDSLSGRPARTAAPRSHTGVRERARARASPRASDGPVLSPRDRGSRQLLRRAGALDAPIATPALVHELQGLLRRPAPAHARGRRAAPEGRGQLSEPPTCSERRTSFSAQLNRNWVIGEKRPARDRVDAEVASHAAMARDWGAGPSGR